MTDGAAQVGGGGEWVARERGREDASAFDWGLGLAGGLRWWWRRRGRGESAIRVALFPLPLLAGRGVVCLGARTSIGRLGSLFLGTGLLWPFFPFLPLSRFGVTEDWEWRLVMGWGEVLFHRVALMTKHEIMTPKNTILFSVFGLSECQRPYRKAGRDWLPFPTQSPSSSEVHESEMA